MSTGKSSMNWWASISRNVYKLGQSVRVRVLDADTAADRTIDFEFCDEDEEYDS